MELTKPIIGITSTTDNHVTIPSVDVSQTYVEAVVRAGGVPIVIPIGTEVLVASLVSICDGFIFTGGEDVSPNSYGTEPTPQIQKTNEKRDQLEMSLIKEATKQKKPILGICRGITMINVAYGGTVIHDIYTANQKAIKHYQQASATEPTHHIELQETSWLYDTFNKTQLRVNSLHHQAIDKLAPTLKIVATASDGTIEAVEGKDEVLVIGVQWHPEEMAKNDPSMQQLFTNFTLACSSNIKRM